VDYSYQKLIAWQRAMELAEQAYSLARLFPAEARYELSSQLRRAAISIPSNIAEGHGRRSRPQFQQFLRVARGSLQELETQVLLAERFVTSLPRRANLSSS
jgi:four helix bundle protein